MKVRTAAALVALALLSGCATSGGATTSGTPVSWSGRATSPTSAVSSAPTPVLSAAPTGTPPHLVVVDPTATLGLDSAFRVAAPVLLAPAGPGPAQWREPCRPAQVTAVAFTRLVGGAVQGVIRLLGEHCSLHVTEGPTQLLDDAGHPLAVALKSKATNDFAGDPRTDLPLAAGDILWGFSWSGSWCGPAATAVVVPLIDDSPGTATTYGTVRAQVRGDQLPCTAGSHSTLNQGYGGDDVSGGEFSSSAEAVLPAPPAWRELTATLDLPSTATATQIPSYSLVLTNATDHPISLLPCADFAWKVDTASTSSADDNEPLPCSGHMSLPSKGSLRFVLPEIAIGSGNPQPYSKGTAVTVTVAVGGVAAASARSRIG